MIAKKTTVAFVMWLLIPAQVLAQCDSSGGTGTGGDYATMVLGGEGGGRWDVTNLLQESTASGAFQFTYETLQDLGYITHDSRSVGSDMYTSAEWSGKALLHGCSVG